MAHYLSGAPLVSIPSIALFLVVRGREEGRERGAAPQIPCPIRTGLGRGARHLLVLPTKAHQGPLLLPRIPVTPRYLRKYPNHSEPFRCPNIVVQYTDLYVLTISRLLVMSPISSGTPNSFGTSKLIITVIVTLSVRTLRFENNVDMTETRLWSITNSGTWMPILAPTYSTKIFLAQTG